MTTQLPPRVLYALERAYQASFAAAWAHRTHNADVRMHTGQPSVYVQEWNAITAIRRAILNY